MNIATGQFDSELVASMEKTQQLREKQQLHINVKQRVVQERKNSMVYCIPSCEWHLRSYVKYKYHWIVIRPSYNTQYWNEKRMGNLLIF